MIIPHYNALKSILDTLPNIEHVYWYNGQYEIPEEHKAKPHTCAYIQFENPINWGEMSGGVLNADTFIRVHVVAYNLQDGPEQVLNLSSEVQNKLQGLSLTDGAEQLSTAMSCNGMNLDDDYDQMKVCILSYEVSLFNCDGVKTGVATNATPSLSLSANLI